MKTASEIYAKVHKQTEGHAKDSLDVIYTAMEEYAIYKTETNDKERYNLIKIIADRNLEIIELKELLRKISVYLPPHDKLHGIMNNYISQPLPKLTQNKV